MSDDASGQRPPEEPAPAATGTGTVDEVDTRVAPAVAGAQGDPAGSLGMGPQQLARLADALYPRLLRQVRHEVLLDRERRGTRTDRRLP